MQQWEAEEKERRKEGGKGKVLYSLNNLKAPPKFKTKRKFCNEVDEQPSKQVQTDNVHNRIELRDQQTKQRGF